MTRNTLISNLVLITLAAVCIDACTSRNEVAQKQATKILEACEFTGGLIVHLGCGDGRLTSALSINGSHLVQGFESSLENVEQAREHVRSLGLYGQVSIERWSGLSLPFPDNSVNLIVVDQPGSISQTELLRVLAPNGVAYLKDDDPHEKIVKPRPQGMDDWTHVLFDATNNAVSNDTLVGPPRQLQWVAGPGWTRSHEHLASVSTAVSSGGRIFYIVDTGPTSAVALEPQWALMARDAFSGVLLWTCSIPRWQWHLRGFRSGPSDLSRRLVAVDDRVYVTLSSDEPLSVLDAATGEAIKTFDSTTGALEFIHHDEVIFAATADHPDKAASETQIRSQRPAYPEMPPPKRLVAVNADTAEMLWEKSDIDTAGLMPTTLAASSGQLYFQNADEILCLEARTGQEIFRIDRPLSRRRPTWTAPTLVIYEDVLLSADRAVPEIEAAAEERQKVEWIVSSQGGFSPMGELIAFSTKNGERLWSCRASEGYNSPVDVLVADGLVWTGNLVLANDEGITQGRDPRTGKVVRTRPKDQDFFETGTGHARCYRNRATNRFLVLGRTGVEFVDLKTGKALPHHWIRGTCQYGVMPANGLLYVPPHSCACFIRSKLNSFSCLAPERPSQSVMPEGARLELGPANSELSTRELQSADNSDWPTYRHDNERSGFTTSEVTSELTLGWNRRLGGRLSSIVVAEGRLLVSQVDAHTVHALDALSGKAVWSYTAGGRVDSPPACWKGRAIFGCRDGWIYCLRSSDGELIWRFRAAPSDQRIVAYGQVESSWPAPGSPILQDGLVYCVAGRSSYLDGGIRLISLNAETGSLLAETVIDDRDPETGYQRKGAVKGTNMPGALPDILSSDGESLFMRHRRFNLGGQEQPPTVPHLFSAAGFLDDSWWHRTYWLIGTEMTTDYGGWPRAGSERPAGRLLVMDDTSVYGFGRNQYGKIGSHVGIDGSTIFYFNPNRHERLTYYQAFSSPREEGSRSDQEPSRTYRWNRQLPILARAMILAQNTLFMAGPPDSFDVTDPSSSLQGGILLALAADDGTELAQYALDSPPVFDGLAAALGRLYMSTTDGHVVCYSGQ